MTEAELRLCRIRDHRRNLEEGLVDRYSQHNYGISLRDVEQIIVDLRHIEQLLQKEIENGNEVR